MKQMKNFNKFITEKATDAGYPVDTDSFGNDLSNPNDVMRINSFLGAMGQIEYLVPEHALDKIRERLQIGLHSGIEVTDQNTLNGQLISQAFCSALPVAYSNSPAYHWDRFANLILEGAYEATLCSAIINATRCGSNKVFLTQLGGGAFGNESSWIYNAMTRAFSIYKDYDLDIRIVSYGSVDEDLERIITIWNYENS